jgi:hypothetical protein
MVTNLYFSGLVYFTMKCLGRLPSFVAISSTFKRLVGSSWEMDECEWERWKGLEQPSSYRSLFVSFLQGYLYVFRCFTSAALDIPSQTSVSTLQILFWNGCFSTSRLSLRSGRRHKKFAHIFSAQTVTTTGKHKTSNSKVSLEVNPEKNKKAIC